MQAIAADSVGVKNPRTIPPIRMIGVISAGREVRVRRTTSLTGTGAIFGKFFRLE